MSSFVSTHRPRIALAVAALIVGVAAACTSSSPNTPSVSFATPTAQTPSNGSAFNFTDQPISVKIVNSPKTGAATTTYALEVASDSGFGNKVFSVDGITEDPTGVTSVPLGSLNGNATYFWHSRAVVDGVGGQFSSTQSFFVRPAIQISAPGLASPTNGNSAVGVRPTLIANNSSHSGPVSTLFYNFQISATSTFDKVIASGVIQEQSGTTSFTPSNDIAGGSYFWRVQAQDLTNKVDGPFSGAAAFKVVPFDMRNASILNNPPNLGSWAETSAITSIIFTPFSFEVEFDKRDGPNRWPEVPFGDGGGGTTQYTLGMCVNPNQAGHWFCSAVVQFWFGRDLDASGGPDNIGIDWFYDGGRWGPIQFYQPQNGETVGIFAANGNLRDSLNWAIEQRTNVVFIPWHSDYVLQNGVASIKPSIRR
jgi:hypothetical protein